MSVHVYISAPKVTNTVLFKHMKTQTLKGVKVHITLTACKGGESGAWGANQGFINNMENISNTQFDKLAKLKFKIFGILLNVVTPLVEGPSMPISINRAIGEP